MPRLPNIIHIDHRTLFPVSPLAIFSQEDMDEKYEDFLP